jgi:diguanylate cyclase (GGDEF)-like protein
MAAETDNARGWRRVHPVWWLNVALCAAAAALAVHAAGYPQLAAPGLSWWLLAGLVAVCERWPVHLHFGRSHHSFSFSDLPLTLALIFATGAGGVTAVLAGVVVAMLLRRLAVVKFVFNVGQFTLTAALAIIVIHALGGHAPAFGLRLWLSALVATQVNGIVTVLLLALAIGLADGHFSRGLLRSLFGMDLVVTMASTSFALVAAIVLVAAPAGLPILAVPVAAACLGYRAYVREHVQHKKLEFLYQANRGLAESPELATAVEGLLRRAREAFRAERAEIVLLGQDEGAQRTRLAPGDAVASLERVDRAAAEALAALAERGPVALSRPLPAAVAPLLDADNAMVAVLRGEHGPIGTIAVADRVGFVHFGEDDLALFDTLADDASAAMQFDRLEQAVGELRELQDRLRHQAYHDPLTGLANRARFLQEIDKLGGEDGVAVLLLNLDDFKGVNEMLGHAVGDQLLCAAAARIARSVREDDVVARLGGDEFAVLLRASREEIDAAAVSTAERAIAAFAAPVAVAEHLFTLHVSVGVAAGPASADLLRDANVAVDEAKAAGKRRYAVFTPGMREQATRRRSLRDDLEAAIAGDGLTLHYQPIVDLADGRLAAVEALVRWRHPVHGMIPPLDFIPIAEESSLIVALGRRVLHDACAQAVAWTEAGGAPVTVQVNLSARELEDPELIDNVAATLAATGLPAERLTLEMTETLLVRDARAGAATLHALKALGLQLALDDFGTGYSSLSYMRALPLDSLKIAKEFIDGMTTAADDAAFVRLIVELARVRGLRVVAEGIETADQLAALRALGCDRGQGYHFARPLEPADPKLTAALGLPGVARAVA